MFHKLTDDDYFAFKKWAEEAGNKSIYGYMEFVDVCPLDRYIGSNVCSIWSGGQLEVVGDDIDGDTISHKLPVWAYQFVVKFDKQHLVWGKVTGNDLLQILDTIKPPKVNNEG